MSYIIEQKIKGRIYLYRVNSYWDKDKKQPRQRREYIGPKDKRLNKASIKKTILRNVISVNFGNIALLNQISNEIGIEAILQRNFPLMWKDVLALAYYEIMEGEPSYKFPYWQEEQYLPGVKKMHSSDISKLFDSIGGMQKERLNFIKEWTEHLKPIQGIYYDITSISSYSGNIDFVEWGYNRDKENLPQLNLGLVCCQEKSLPFYYSLFPGSIVDVTTIKNQLKYFDILNLKDILLIMDRGFCSTGNLTEMNENGMLFIQPLSFSLKKAKVLVNENKRILHDSKVAFKYNEEIVHYVNTTIDIGNVEYDAHIYLNEKAEVSQRHLFLSRLIETEQKFEDKTFSTLDDFEKYSNDYISEKMRPYYQWNKKQKNIERNQKSFNAYLANLGYIVFASNKKNLGKSYILDCYRHKDDIEKMFDVLKNEMDGDRLRVHSRWNTEGKLFVKFVALIIYMRISKIMKMNKLFDKYTLKEMLMELRKIKLTTVESYEPIISEISKKQKILIDVFNLNLNHSY